MEQNIVYIDVYNNCNKTKARIPLEELLVEVLASLVPASYHIEALKAGAVLVRSLIISKLRPFEGTGCGKYQGVDICTEGHCVPFIDTQKLQDIWGEEYQSNIKKVKNAVEGTRDKIITLKGKPIKPRYHINCGGSTINSEDLLGNKILYLRKVLCEYCNQGDNLRGSKSFSIEELEEALGVRIKRQKFNWGADIEGVIETVKRDEEDRIVEIKIGNKVFKGHELMDTLGLDSTKFGWAPAYIIFESKGKGDGLGFCIEGSNGMAQKGFKYDEILKYYFTSIDIKTIDFPRINMALYGKTIIIDPGHGYNISFDSLENIGPTGLREGVVNLDIALKLAELLSKEGCEVHLTRDKDEDVALHDRKELSNKLRPDFFISIHQNGFSNSTTSGAEIYHYRGDKEGEKLSKLIIKNLVSILDCNNRGVKTADFYLLREVRSSSIHIETAYITNPQQEELLRQDISRQYIAKAIYLGILDYYNGMDAPEI